MNGENRRAAQRAQKKRVKQHRRAAEKRRRARNAFVPVDPIAMAISGVKPCTAQQRNTIALRNHGALALITQGKGGDAEVSQLGSMVNVTLVLVEMTTAEAKSKGRHADTTHLQMAGLALDVVKDAQVALLRMAERRAASGTYELREDELAVVNECLGLHDDFMAAAPVSMVERAYRTAIGRINSGNAATNESHIQRAA